MSKLSLARALGWSAAATLIKIAVDLLLIKWLAVAFGPDGVGRAGNFMALVAVLSALSGAGIHNGVTKYVAEFQHDPVRLRRLLGTAAALVLGCSSLLALLFILAAAPLSELLFGSKDFQGVLRAIALIQLGMACAQFFLAILKGRSDAKGTALSMISGSLLGLGAYWIAFRCGGYQGALIGLALVPALLVLPAGIMLCKSGIVPRNGLQLTWDGGLARNLLKFTAMMILTAISLPIAYTAIRELLAVHYGWDEVGIWQGMNRVSEAYLQLITAPFTVYLLPALSRQKAKQDFAHEIGRAQRFLFPLAVAVSLSLWLLRDSVIGLFFSVEFRSMRDLFAWQLSGDAFKISAYVFAYLVTARASLSLGVLTQISQFGLLLLFSHGLIPAGGALGAVQAYAATYVIYCALCASAFFFYCKKD
ncbi:lipid III flippase WzxE [Mycoavidus sp. SF9855]|uniref:lipid III flippase WzxE n=1 Tax=Mycoavidus sp. SF9855 TaxID=2968475 RepID=UPI00211C4B40|nr:lipid III flippase WzxE [Mycoavidus sp. SF9855]UUM21479.1 lipid III flippase WzxE [Mycoavidus sp. SF9855]